MTKYAAPDRVTAAPPAALFDPPPVACNFADAGRTYPLHAPAAAWASAAAYHDAGATDPAAGERIKAACVYYGLSAEWDRLAAARPAGPVAPPPDRWALPEQRRYPLDTAAAVKAAADYFARYADRLAAADRRTFAGELVKAAADHPGVVDPAGVWRLEAEAGLGRPAPGWEAEARWRAKMAADAGEPGLAAAIEKAAAEAAQDQVGAPVGTYRTAGELAALMRAVDRRMGWELDDPLPGLVGDTPSTARAKLAAAVEAASGAWYARADLDRVPDAACAAVGLGPIVARATKAAALAASPAFERLALAHGVVPVRAAPRARVDWAAVAAAG